LGGRCAAPLRAWGPAQPPRGVRRSAGARGRAVLRSQLVPSPGAVSRSAGRRSASAVRRGGRRYDRVPWPPTAGGARRQRAVGYVSGGGIRPIAAPPAIALEAAVAQRAPSLPAAACPRDLALVTRALAPDQSRLRRPDRTGAAAARARPRACPAASDGAPRALAPPHVRARSLRARDRRQSRRGVRDRAALPLLRSTPGGVLPGVALRSEAPLGLHAARAAPRTQRYPHRRSAAPGRQVEPRPQLQTRAVALRTRHARGCDRGRRLGDRAMGGSHRPPAGVRALRCRWAGPSSLDGSDPRPVVAQAALPDARCTQHDQARGRDAGLPFRTRPTERRAIPWNKRRKSARRTPANRHQWRRSTSIAAQSSRFTDRLRRLRRASTLVPATGSTVPRDETAVAGTVNGPVRRNVQGLRPPGAVRAGPAGAGARRRRTRG